MCMCSIDVSYEINAGAPAVINGEFLKAAQN